MNDTWEQQRGTSWSDEVLRDSTFSRLISISVTEVIFESRKRQLTENKIDFSGHHVEKHCEHMWNERTVFVGNHEYFHDDEIKRIGDACSSHVN